LLENLWPWDGRFLAEGRIHFEHDELFPSRWWMLLCE
jgi:hypothetical protein